MLQRLFVATASLCLAIGLSEWFVRTFIDVRIVGAAFTTYDSNYGRRLKKNTQIETDTREFRTIATFNDLGFRGPSPAIPSQGVLLFLGDSFTMGYGVNDGEEYPQRVSMLLRDILAQEGISVLNAGIPDTGNGHWVKFLRDQARSYEPVYVVLQFTNNDYFDNPREKLFELSSDGALLELPAPNPGWAWYAERIFNDIPGLDKSHLVGLMRQAMAQRAERPPADPELTMALLDESIRLCAQNAWPVLMIVVEMEGPTVERLESTWRKEMSVPLLRVPSKKQRPELYFHVDGHWSPSGHAYVAEQVAHDFLERRRVGEIKSSLR